jgi:hypothetical protein
VFESRDDALVWIIRNQLGRRNLNSYQRGELVQRYKPLVAAQSEQGKRTDLSNFSQNSGRSSDLIGTDRKLAQMAGISHDTLHKVGKLSKAADEETKQKLRRGEVSVNKAYTEVMHRQHADETKACGRCGQEKPYSDFAIPSNRQGFSALCRACEKEVAEAPEQTEDVAQEATTQVTAARETLETREQPESPSISSVGIHKGHPIHVTAPLPDRPEMFPHVENHMRFIVENFLAGAQNAMKLYTSGMASPGNTRILRGILGSVMGAVEAFEKYVKEIRDHE